MDKPLNRIGVLFLATSLLTVALSAVFVLLSGVGRDSVTAYFHEIRKNERLNEDRNIIYEGISHCPSGACCRSCP
jgi:hypothetical protein